VALPSISWFFLFAFALNGLIAISILLFKNKTFRLANSLLAINLIGISLSAITVSLLESRLILQVPHYYRLPSPIIYAMFPAAYLYVKLILEDRPYLKRWEYLHFLPALLHLIEMTPFYLSNTETKIMDINHALSRSIEMFAHSEGQLPAFVHNIIRGVLALTYSLAMWRLISRAKLNHSFVTKYSATVIRWLKIFTVINALMGVALIVFLSIVSIPAELRAVVIIIVLSTALIIPNLYLFLRPEILYGMPQPILKDTSSSLVSSDIVIETKTEIPPFIYQYKNQVQQYLIESRRYLNSDFSLEDLARATSIPKHHLQLLIYKVEGMKFSEFINDFRIQHLKEQIENGGIRHKTLEGLAAESGFSSKATFIRSVKKLTGRTPKDYFNHSKSAV